MKILLKKNVKNLGSKGAIIEVSRGFGVNNIVKTGVGVIPTVHEELLAIKNFSNIEKNSKEFIETSNKTIEALKGKTILFLEKVSNKNHLFGSISEKNIVDRIKKDFSIELQESQVSLDKHIKEIGDHRVEINFSSDLYVAVTIRVEKS
jgi:large subunit ribosomal protein L9